MGPIKSAVWFWIHRHRRNRVVARFARLCKNIHRASEHPGYDVNTDGERDLLRHAVSSPAPVLFDVGANVGDWSTMAREVIPSASIHAFELSPRTADLLTQRMEHVPGIRVHAFGLADKSGERNFFSYSGDSNVLSGLRAPIHSHVPHQIEKATVRTGDEVCRALGVTRIDFLKVDAEGGDYEVLAGFSSLLAEQKISVIQFEHEGGRYLRDFYEFLEPKGYAVGKLYSNYVDFRNHSSDLEHVLGPNYVAVPAAQSELIEMLRKGW
jgi:FkbM family methyltransferase